MSRYYGGVVRQAAFVIHDMDETLRYWTEELGIGPFFVMRRLKIENFEYRGKPSPPPVVSVAMAYSGEMQIEIIQQHDGHPSAYTDFLNAGKTGFHHWSSMLTPAEFDKVVSERKKSKTSIAHQGTFMDGTIRFLYFNTDPEHKYGGMYFEIADYLGSPLGALMDTFKEAALNWDGSEPIREVPLG